MHIKSTALAVLLVAVAASTASAQVIISEFHYNPNGTENDRQEWIEIYNTGSSAVDLSGWTWGDSFDNQFTQPFAAGTILNAREAAVLIYQSPTIDGTLTREDNVAIFRQIWGTGFKIIPTFSLTATGGTFPAGQTEGGISLANGPTATNRETIALRDPSNVIVDAVDYENNINGWPATGGVNSGRSFYALPTALTATDNNLGANWALSAVDTNGGRLALINHPQISNATTPDTGSPGFVAAPSVPSLVKGDFGGNESSDGSFNSPDNTFDGLDIEGFLLALNSEASYLALNPTLSSSSLVTLGDFGGNESTDGSFNTPDGAFDGLDIEGFLLALNNPTGYAAIQPSGFGGVSAIPEPAALGLLAPLGMLAARRRR